MSEYATVLLFIGVMGFTGRDDKPILFHLINEPVLSGNTPGPKSGKIAPQRFGVTCTGKGCSCNLFNEELFPKLG
jgi:hypothetical protein